MVASTSRLSYIDCTELMDQALENTKGIRIGFADKGDALHFRTRMHTARTICRKDNLSEYAPGHPLHGRSQYDVLVVREPKESEGKWWLYIEKRHADQLIVQPLGEEMKVIEHEELKALPAPTLPVVTEPEITIFDPPKVFRRV